MNRRSPARTARRRSAKRRPGEAADALAALSESLAVLLDAGLAPRSAWSAAARQGLHPLAERVASRPDAERSGSGAVREAARSEDERAIAAVWEVAERSGAPLSHALRSVGESLRDAAEAEREADVALSGPRATARLVSWLPAAGFGMGFAMGADVVGAAMTTIGAGALVAGALLMVGGRWWMRRLVEHALAGKPLAGQAEELIAVALGGGASVDAAVATVQDAVRSAGLPPLETGGADDVLRLAASAGAPAGELLSAAARQRRRVARADARRAAATLGVRLMLPLGVCVLPSFLLMAVAPLLLSLISSTTAGLR